MCYTVSRASVEKFSGGGATEKRPKNNTIKPLPGRPTEIKTEK